MPESKLHSSRRLKTQTLSASGASPPDSLTGVSAPGPHWELHPQYYRLALRAGHVSSSLQWQTNTTLPSYGPGYGYRVCIIRASLTRTHSSLRLPSPVRQPDRTDGRTALSSAGSGRVDNFIVRRH